MQHVRLLCPSLSLSLLKLMSIELVMPFKHLILCHPFLLLPSVFPSIRVFSNESTLRIRWPEYWSFNVNISPSNEYSRLISFRIDCFDLLAVQGTLKSLFQHHSSKASIFQCSDFFMVQISHPNMTTGETIALTIWAFARKVISLLFNTLSKFVRASLVAQRLKHLPPMRETWVRSLGREGPLEKEMATHSSTLAWKIPWTEEPDRLQFMGSERVWHNWVTSISVSSVSSLEGKLWPTWTAY